MTVRLILVLTTLAAVAAGPAVPGALRPEASLTGLPASVTALAMSPDGKLLAASRQLRPDKAGEGGAEIQVWELSTRKLLTTWRPTGGVPVAVAFSPDGKGLVSTTGYDLVHWDVPTGRQLRAPDWPDEGTDSLTQVAFSADGKRLGVWGDREAVTCDSQSDKMLTRRRWKIRGPGAVLSPDLRTVVTPNHQDVDIWDIRTGKLVLSLLDHHGVTGPLALSADGRLLAVPCRGWKFRKGTECEVVLWDLPAGRRRRTIALDGLTYTHAALSPRGDLLALTGQLEHEPAHVELQLFDVATGGELAHLRLPAEVQPVAGLAFHPDGRRLALGGHDGTVRLWRIDLPRAAGRSVAPERPRPPIGVAEAEPSSRPGGPWKP